MLDKKDLEKKCIDTIRFLAADAIEKAKSGHPGMPLGAAAAHRLPTKRLKLLAFSLGAAIAGLFGAVFGARNVDPGLRSQVFLLTV